MTLVWKNSDNKDCIVLNNSIVLSKYDCIKFKRKDLDNKLTYAKILGFTFSGDSPPKGILFTPYRMEEKRWSSMSLRLRKICEYDYDSIEKISKIDGVCGYEFKKNN